MTTPSAIRHNLAFVAATTIWCAAWPGNRAVAAPSDAAPPSAAVEIAPFSSDGCSSFPDRSPVGRADWCGCCLAHDLAYWRGGTADERLAADEALRHCVQARTGSAELADVMFAGVRIGGGPYLQTSYRWGYGWSQRSPYQALTAEEEAQVKLLRDRYLASNPTLACPATAP